MRTDGSCPGDGRSSAIRHRSRVAMAGPLISVLLALFGSPPVAAAKDEVATEAVGPFTIEGSGRRISTGAFPNTSGNPFATMKVSSYRVLHQGKPVSAVGAIDRTDGMDLHSGPDAGGERFWDVRALDGAPRPALIAGNTGVWLIDEADGRPRVQMLAAPDSDMASWQFLDAQDGQPGAEHLIGIRDSSAEPRHIGGGRLLLINHRMLLDVATLELFPMRINTTEFVDAASRFNAGGKPVLALSPSRRQLVWLGYDDQNDMGLVVADYRSKSVYALPIAAESMDFIEPSDFRPDWFAHFFEWRDAGGPNERLVLRAKPGQWPRLGRFVDFGDTVEYRIPAVDERMLLAFRQFVEALPDCTLDRANSDGESFGYVCDGKPMKLWRNGYLVDLYAERPKGFLVPGTGERIRAIGEQFNALLKSGKHQGLFLSSKDMP